jgi:hypothetical protein
MVRKGQNPDTFLKALAAGVSIESQLKREAARPKPSWTWEKAKTEFLAEVKRANREDTHRDYRGKLRPAELTRFDGRAGAERPAHRQRLHPELQAGNPAVADIVSLALTRVAKCGFDGGCGDQRRHVRPGHDPPVLKLGHTWVTKSVPCCESTNRSVVSMENDDLRLSC